MLDSSNFRRAVKITTPVFFGYIAIGIPFGLMVVNAGFSWWFAIIMSLLIYSGTGQYIGIALFSSGIIRAESFWESVLAFIGVEFFIVRQNSILQRAVLNEIIFLVKLATPYKFCD